MEQDYYTLRYREGALGVSTSWIKASSPEAAQLVGQAFCNQTPNRRFIRVEQTVVADESILSAEDKARAAEQVRLRVESEALAKSDKETPARVQPQQSGKKSSAA